MKIFIRIVKWTLISLFSLVLVISILNFVPFTISSVSKNNTFLKEGKYPLIIPHGGAKELVPENTVFAYNYLMEHYNPQVLEIDLAMTADGQLISQHDLYLTMSPGSQFDKAFVRSHSYAEIVQAIKADDYYLARTFTEPEDLGGQQPYKDLDANDPIMQQMIPARIRDIFEEVNDKVLYILEIKDAPEEGNKNGYTPGLHDYEVAAAELISLVREFNLEDRVVLASFSDEVTDYFKENAPEMLMAAATSEVTMWAVLSAFNLDFFWPIKSEVLILPNPSSMRITGGTAKLLDMIPSIFRDYIALPEGDYYRANFMHAQMINDAHRKGMAVLYWTVNDPEEMKLLIELGADGIITDRPDLLKALIDQMKAEEQN